MRKKKNFYNDSLNILYERAYYKKEKKWKLKERNCCSV